MSQTLTTNAFQKYLYFFNFYIEFKLMNLLYRNELCCDFLSIQYYMSYVTDYNIDVKSTSHSFNMH